ncbi:MAG: acyltransferase [Muribaculaceae bacterium]|nr:acyltransferase [Muribaculaceae bacterium]
MDVLRTGLSYLISKIKKEKFEIDKNIPLSYLIQFLFSRVCALIYGMISFKTLAPIYRYGGTIVKCKSKVKLGRNSTIANGCIIDGMSINGIISGANCSFGYNTTMIASGSLQTIGVGIKIGNNVGLGTNGFFGGGGGLEIGDNTIFGNYVSIHPENHNYSDLNILIRAQGVNRKGIKIGNNCWIGAKVTILDGSEIGDGCIIAAGAVIRGEFPDNAIIGGVPAKILKYRN